MKLGLTSRIVTALAALGAAALLLLAGVAWFASLRADQVSVERQAEFLTAGITEQIERVPRDQESVTIWDDAVMFTRAGDQQWMAENVGDWMYTYFGHDRAYVVTEQDLPVYSMNAGATVWPPQLRRDDKDQVTRLVARLRADAVSAGEDPDARGAVTAAEVTSIGERPAVVSAKLIVPATMRRTLKPGAEYVHVALMFLDAAPLESVGARYRLQGLRFVPPGAPVSAGEESVPLAASDGSTLGGLAWMPERPGVTLMQDIAPAAVAAVAIIIGIAFYLFRGLQRAALRIHASENLAHFLSRHDTLTGLPNRLLFDERIEEAMALARSGATGVAVLYLDLDRFKNINDTLGHRAGDELIHQTAARLKWEVQNLSATVARVGGDEFGIIVTAPDAMTVSTQLAERLIAAIAHPFAMEGEPMHVSASIGIALAPEHSSERDDITRKADIALYEARKAGRGRYRIYAPDMGNIVQQRRVIETDLRVALEGGQGLHLVYQPLFSSDGRPTGAEALLRWKHPQQGALAPDFVVSVAEEAGLISGLGEWVLREACDMAAGVSIPWIAVNVSALQLREKDFPQRVLAILAQKGLEPSRLQIEITEGVLIDDPVAASAALGQLREAGIRVALDDFGTGYSSMGYLRDYAIDKLKIDRSFTQGLADDDGRAIVAAILAMAQAMKLDVVAEGVETRDQQRLLTQMGCQEMQGYLFSRPLDAQDFARLYGRPVEALSA